MGVDASYLYGYSLEDSSVEWDLEYLKEKYKDKMDMKASVYSWSDTYRDIIAGIESYIEEDGEIDFYDLGDQLGFDYHSIDYGDSYIVFNHKHIAKLFPDTKLSKLDDAARLYAKEIGIKNVDDVKWREFGYFD